LTDQHSQGMEMPSVFRATNYHGIEYRTRVDRSLYMKTCGIQRCLPGYSYPHNRREGAAAEHRSADQHRGAGGWLSGSAGVLEDL